MRLKLSPELQLSSVSLVCLFFVPQPPLNMAAPAASTAALSSRSPSYGPVACNLEHDATPSAHLHRFVPCVHLCSPAETHQKALRPSIESCGLRDGATAWPAYQSWFHAQQSVCASSGVQLKTLSFLRHAEGTHNEAEARVGYRVWEDTESQREEYTDPDLTAKGVEQCNRFAKQLPAAIAHGFKPQLVLCSPMLRTLRTAAICLDALPAESDLSSSSTGGPHWIVLESARETLGNHTCDKRHPITEATLSRFPRHQFHLLRENHDALWTEQRETDEALLLRAQRLLDFLFHVPEEHIVIVAHSGIIGALSQLIAKPFAPAASGTPVDSTVPAATTAATEDASPATVLEVLRADGALSAETIDARHCELQPFCVARLPLNAAVAAKPGKL